MKINEIDVLVIVGLSFFFIYSLWQIDISVGAIGTGGILKSIRGYSDPYDTYHISLFYAMFSYLVLLGYLLIRNHYNKWKNEQDREHKTFHENSLGKH